MYFLFQALYIYIYVIHFFLLFFFSFFLFFAAKIVKDVDGPSKKYIGPYTKKEHGTYLAVQQGRKQNRILSALGQDMMVRVHPDLKKKKKKNSNINPKDAASSSSDNEENSSDGESDSSDESCDDSSSSESSEHTHTAPSVQENLSPALKRKKMPSSSPVDSNLKKVRIALDSDDEDENILSYELPAISEISSVEIGNVSNVNSLSAAADHLSAPLNVLTSAAKEVEEPICIDAIDVDMNPVNPVQTENVPEVVNLNFQSRKNIVEDQATE